MENAPSGTASAIAGGDETPSLARFSVVCLAPHVPSSIFSTVGWLMWGDSPREAVDLMPDETRERAPRISPEDLLCAHLSEGVLAGKWSSRRACGTCLQNIHPSLGVHREDEEGVSIVWTQNIRGGDDIW